MISRLTQGEFNTLKKGYLSMDSNPGASLALLDTMQGIASRRLQLSQTWDQLPLPAKNAITRTPGGFTDWYQHQVGDQLAARNISPTGAVPQYAKGSDGWVHVDTGSGDTVKWRPVQ